MQWLFDVSTRGTLVGGKIGAKRLDSGNGQGKRYDCAKRFTKFHKEEVLGCDNSSIVSESSEILRWSSLI